MVVAACPACWAPVEVVPGFWPECKECGRVSAIEVKAPAPRARESGWVGEEASTTQQTDDDRADPWAEDAPRGHRPGDAPRAVAPAADWAAEDHSPFWMPVGPDEASWPHATHGAEATPRTRDEPPAASPPAPGPPAPSSPGPPRRTHPGAPRRPERATSWTPMVVGVFAITLVFAGVGWFLDMSGGAAGHTVYFGPFPAFMDEADQADAEEAIRLALLLSSQAGHEVSRTDREDEATIHASWVQGGGKDMASHPIPIALGDRACSGQWTAYTVNTVANIIAHEIRQAIGHSEADTTHPALRPAYKEWCVWSQGATGAQAGQVLHWDFTLHEAATAGYHAEGLYGLGIDACIMDPAHRAALAPGDRFNGWACHEGVQHVEDGSELEAGTYSFVLRCTGGQACVVSYELGFVA